MIDVDKLEEIFKKRYEELSDEASDEEFFVNWCDEHKILIMHAEWVRETFNESRKDMVCIFHPHDFDPEAQFPCNWLLVPKKLAEKTLVLGYLP